MAPTNTSQNPYVLTPTQVAGVEAQSFVPGQRVYILESQLTHPTHADGFVDSGDPVAFPAASNEFTGVARNSATAATEYIAVDVANNGVHLMSILAEDNGGGSAVAYGDLIYLDAGVINKDATGIRLGMYLGETIPSTTTAVGPVLSMPLS